MPNYLSILRSQGLVDYPLKCRHRIKKGGVKALSATAIVCLLSALSEQPSLSSPLLVESRAHYTLTTPRNETATGSSESTIIEGQANPPKPSVNRESNHDAVDSSADVLETIVAPVTTPFTQTELAEPELKHVR